MSNPGETLNSRRVRVDREPLPRDVVHAIARPEFQADVMELLRDNGALSNGLGTLSILMEPPEPPSKPDGEKTLLLVESAGAKVELHRGRLLEFLRAHEQWVGNQDAIDNGRYNQELADEILDIVMKEEDIICAEWKLPILSDALTEAKKRIRNWMVAAGLALAAAAVSAGALNSYAGKEVADDVAEWTDNAGDAIQGAQRDLEQWWKDLTDDKTDEKLKRKKPRSKK